MPRISRRALLAAAPAIGFLASKPGLAEPSKLTLEPSGSPRRLPKGLFSASLEVLIEHMIDDQRKIEALEPMKLGFGRFPGGSQSDFYDWRKGQLALEVEPNSSGYVKFWGRVAPNINNTWKNGLHYEQYVNFCLKIGAEAIWVPNLETSTVDDQVAWLKHIVDQGAAPHHVEMGNEFYVALLNDPDSAARWPNEPATRKVIRQYVEAFRPHLPKDAKIATQACHEEFGGHSNPGPFSQRMRHWNDTIHAEDWFDAITIHLYAQIGNLTHARDTSDPGQAKQIFDAVMAHHDDGMEKALTALGARVPGKEIWITEWSPRGGDPTPGPNGRDSITHSMYAQAVARAQFTMLRVPQVTMSLFFMFNFTLKPVFAVFDAMPDGSFAPMPPAVPVIWFAQAANGGVEYRRYLEGGTRTPGGGLLNESYTPVEAALFKGDSGSTLLVQNATASSRTLQMPAGLGKPAKAETLAMPDLTDQTRTAARISGLPSGPTVDLPAWSLTRLIWPG
jgi:hypothetical protein